MSMLLLLPSPPGMIPKMAASIASGTLGTGAADHGRHGKCGDCAKRLHSARPPLPWSRQPEEPGQWPAAHWRQLKRPVRWEARRLPRALPPLLVVWVKRQWKPPARQRRRFRRRKRLVLPVLLRLHRPQRARHLRRLLRLQRHRRLPIIFSPWRGTQATSTSRTTAAVTRHLHNCESRGRNNSARKSYTPNTLYPSPSGVG